MGKKSADLNTEFDSIELGEGGRTGNQAGAPDVNEEDLNRKQQWWWILIRVVLAIGLLYAFICSLDLMGSAFKLLGGKEAGEVFSQDHIITNPIAGVVIGVLVTVLLQSSSTSTSIVVTMVAADILDVETAVPIIMGANIGTSVTSTIVAIGQIQDDNMFERAFAAATVHDMFNLLSVVIMLPLQWATEFLSKLAKEVVEAMNLSTNEDAEVEILSRITDPLMDKIVLVNKTFIKEVAKGEKLGKEEQVMKIYKLDWDDWWDSVLELRSETGNDTVTTERERCDALFCDSDMSDKAAGGINLAIALVIMFICLFFIVKILNSIFRGQIAKITHKIVNIEFKGDSCGALLANYLIGYVALLVGVGLTILVQSSSIFTSTLTPLVGLNIISLERAFPMTLGANIGTTVTGFLAALASDSNFDNALTISLCHLFFNIFGICIWYPLVFMRKVPLQCARHLGRVTKNYKWFAFVYLLIVFVILPGVIFSLSLAGEVFVGVFCGVIVLIGLIVAFIKLMQRYASNQLPPFLRNWKFLPKWMRSLEPYHNAMIGVFNLCLPEKKKMEKVKKGSRDSTGSGSSDGIGADGIVLTGKVVKKNEDDFYSGPVDNQAYDKSAD